jgi:hypothetical protein
MWAQYDIKALGDRKAIGKFFSLDPEKDIHYIDSFEFSFGQKNIPGLRLGKLIEQNPDLIFLARQSTDYDVVYALERFDQANNKLQRIFIERSAYGEYGGNQLNKKLIEEYAQHFPYLMDKIKDGSRTYDWSYFFNDFGKAADILSRADDYKEMTDPAIEANLEFDNALLEE